MSSSLSRRKVTTAAAWATPAVILTSAAPAASASAVCTGTVTTIKRYTYVVDGFTQVGADGWLNTVAFWTTVTENPKPAVADPCVNWVDNTGEAAVISVINQRVAGSTGSRVRSISLTQANPNYTDVTKTVDPAGKSSHPLGSNDYEWLISFTPSNVYNMADHRFYTTLSNGDGGLIGGRIMNNLVIDGVVQDPQF